MTYLLRLNLDIKEKNFKDNLRFKAAVSTIKAIQKRGHKVVILSHRGRPKGKDGTLSLRPFVPVLSRVLNRKVVFMPDFNFDKAKQKIAASPPRSVFLLENLRFLPGENRNSQTLARQLSTLADRYINDDFATAHREAASVVAITKFLPSQAGPILKAEVKNLSRVKNNPRHPLVVIIGGAKTEDKLGVIKNLLPKADWILLGGGPANTFLAGRGFNIGKSLHAPALLRELKPIINHKKIVTPIDWLTEGGKILDIGPETRALYAEIIAQAKTIVWNGPMGLFEQKKFSHGTEAIARAILKNKVARTIIGGGETITSLGILNTRYKIQDTKNRNLFLSTGGGAMLDFLAGKKLPAIEALRKKHAL
ncbi:MAG: phosphoglycerate kinase [Candidatus Colwellbacteria bacterium]|nr:phosphoglycerate kinase [Candidatus Colwellbacteria bacterium]